MNMLDPDLPSKRPNTTSVSIQGVSGFPSKISLLNTEKSVGDTVTWPMLPANRIKPQPFIVFD